MIDDVFQVGVCECPDINASAFGLDVNGRYALLSGRKGILLVDLDGQNSVSQDSDIQAIKENQATVKQGDRNNVPIIRRLPRNSKYDPTAVHFNRHMADLFALATYQVVEVFSIEDLNPSKPKLLFRGHSRTIADIEWSHFSPYILGSCSADCLTNIWDIRDSRRPTASLTSVSGPTQVRFCKTSSNLLATSHEIDVRIWDIRQPNLPLYYIAAHLQKINGMDWNPNKTNCDQDQLITCSQDNTIKLWDLNANKIKPSSNFPTKWPSWRIRYSPVSSFAILTSTLPQLRSRNECSSMKLWSMKSGRYEQNKLEPIITLAGHTDVIVDFDWRARLDSNDVEIVSWSKDKTLRIWRLDPQLIELSVDNSDFEGDQEQQAVRDKKSPTQSPGKKPLSPTPKQDSPRANKSTGEPASSSPTCFDETRKSTKSIKSDDDDVKNLNDDLDHTGGHVEQDAGSGDDEFKFETISTTNELKQEFNLLNKNIPNLEFEELNSLRRVCLVTARAKSVTCRLRIALPPSYPQTDCPTFTIIDDSFQYAGDTLTKQAKEILLSILDETAQSQLSRGRNCIEPCLRKFVAELQKQTNLMPFNRDRQQDSVQEYQKDDPISISAQRDHSIPFPPTSGARFCGNLLVTFGRPIIPSLVKQTGTDTGGANWLVETPRSMAQLSAQLDNMRRQGSYNLSTISISHFYYGAMRRNELQNRYVNRNLYGSKYLSNRSKSILQAQSISKTYKCGPVVVYDISNLMGGISRELAENYIFDKDVIKMCRRNAEIASSYNRKDLVQIWSLAELSSEGMLNSYIARSDQSSGNRLSLFNNDSDFGDRPWTLHPFGSKLIQSLIDHFVNNCHDVQTAAMLVWTFSSPKVKGEQQSNSDEKIAESKDDNVDAEKDSNELVAETNQDDALLKFNILDPVRALQNDLIMHVYAELLYRLNLLNQRAMVLKNIGNSSAYNDLFNSEKLLAQKPKESIAPNLNNLCANPVCNEECSSVQCTGCKKYTLYCSICRLPVRGSCSICMKCLHGGHVVHFDVWFNSYNFCPTGCGCECLNVESIQQ